MGAEHLQAFQLRNIDMHDGSEHLPCVMSGRLFCSAHMRVATGRPDACAALPCAARGRRHSHGEREWAHSCSNNRGCALLRCFR